EQDAVQAATKEAPGKTEVKPGGDAPAPKPVQVDKKPAPPPASDPKTVSGESSGTQPKVETPPVAEGGGGATRIGIEASRFRSAGRFLAEEAPGLLLQLELMLLFPPEVHIHKENYDDLRKQKIDPALQQALTQQEAAFNKLANADPAQSILATVTVQ